MYRVKKIALFTFISFLILFLLMGFNIKSNVDALAANLEPKITVEVFKTSFKEINESTGKYLDFAEYIMDNVSAREKNFRGFLYFAQPQTDWVIATQYINVILYINGYDSRYFAGFSVPRVQFVLASPNYELFDIDPPADDEVILLVDSRFRFSSDPIFQIIKESNYIALYYPEVLSLKFNYTLIFNDTSGLADHIGLPDSVEYDVGVYDFRESPPVYVLVNRKTYVDIITVLEPVVFGKLYIIELYPNYNGNTFVDKYTSTVELISKIRDKAIELGIDDARIRSTNLISFVDSIQVDIQATAIPYLITSLVLAAVIPFVNIRFRRKKGVKKGGRDITIYLIPLYIVLLFAIQYLFRWTIYIPMLEIIIFIFLPTTLLIYLTFKGRI